VERIFGEGSDIGGDDRTQIFAEGDIDRRTIVRARVCTSSASAGRSWPSRSPGARPVRDEGAPSGKTPLPPVASWMRLSVRRRRLPGTPRRPQTPEWTLCHAARNMCRSRGSAIFGAAIVAKRPGAPLPSPNCLARPDKGWSPTDWPRTRAISNVTSSCSVKCWNRATISAKALVKGRDIGIGRFLGNAGEGRRAARGTSHARRYRSTGTRTPSNLGLSCLPAAVGLKIPEQQSLLVRAVIGIVGAKRRADKFEDAAPRSLSSSGRRRGRYGRVARRTRAHGDRAPVRNVRSSSSQRHRTICW